jgi:hypothetical protein
MYSPIIRDEYIPLLYRKAKELNIPMTKLVNRIIAEALKAEALENTHDQKGTHAFNQKASPPKKDDS